MASPVHPYSDYGVALRTLKSARAWLGYLLLFCVIFQFVGFALMYYTQQPYEGMKPEYTRLDQARETVGPLLRGFFVSPNAEHEVATAPSTAPELFRQSAEARRLNVRAQWEATYTMVVPITQTIGLMSAMSQTTIVFLTLLLILVAQAPGVAQVTRSLIWTTILFFLVLPWQYFAKNYPIPGILYGYEEMLRLIGPQVVPGEIVYRYEQFLVFARFILWPLFGMLILLITSERFRAGLMLAIGHPLQTMMQPRPAYINPPTPNPVSNPQPTTSAATLPRTTMEKK